jgi:glycosyltransferase involved in cell wall biosynthesis
MLGEITAILAIRNEEAYLGNCLRHLIRNGLRLAIIDNGSTDASPQIYRAAEFRPHLVDVWEAPFTGAFSLEEQLKLKLEVAQQVGGDWVVHVDADEMMHSCRDGETLADGLRRLGADGWNSVNFDEFVFLPIEQDYTPDEGGFPKLDLYYFFEPSFPRLMRAWKSGCGLSMFEAAGHRLDGPNLRLAPESFALRHYIFRDQTHAFEKYTARTFAATDLRRGWHGNRINYGSAAFRLPPAGALKRLRRLEDHRLDKSDPWRLHYWEVGASSLGRG